MLKHTPLQTAHEELGAKLIDFGGWEMPVYYTSIVDEHRAVRSAGGLFDISHMGEVRLSGSAAESFLNETLTNDVRNLSPGTGQYTLMCNERGGVVDDLYCYRIGPESFLLVINASRIGADTAWLQQRWDGFGQKDLVTLRDVSAEMGAVAVQGPKVREIIDACVEPGPDHPDLKPSGLAKNQIAKFKFATDEVWVGCTGYTGEDGFELITSARVIDQVWRCLLAQGEGVGLKPAGLGARDTLRTEMCYPLYGHELNEETTPIEAGLGFFVALDKGEFVGREVLARQKAEGVARRCVAFRVTERSAPPRPGYPILSGEPDARPVGEVVSGTQSPSLNCGIGMGYVDSGHAKVNTPIQIEVRGRRIPAVIVRKPIYRRETE